MTNQSAWPEPLSVRAMGSAALPALLALLFCLAGMAHGESSIPDPDIETPGPDFANFPNSAFTLPQGRFYLEMAPATYSGRSSASSQEWSAGYLLRYGVTDQIELRWLSRGLIVPLGDSAGSPGFGPQIFEVKWHLLDEQNWFPAVGVEAFLQTNWASDEHKGGTQPALTINLDQSLPFDITVEYNIGFNGNLADDGRTIYQLNLSWALQREMIDDVALFVHGFTVTAGGDPLSAIGGGAQWTIHERMALFANVNTGLTTATSSLFTLLGFALAF